MPAPMKPKHRHRLLYLEMDEKLQAERGGRYMVVCVAGRVADGCHEVRYDGALPPGFKKLNNAAGGYMFDAATLEAEAGLGHEAA